MSDFEFTSSDVKPKRGRLAVTKPEDEKTSIETEAEKGDKKEKAKKVPKYSEDELLTIFDEIIFVGEYSEDVSIKGRLKLRFRTRSTKEIESISKLIDEGAFNLIQTLNEARFLLNVQYALVEYNGKDLSGLTVEDRAKFVRTLPGPIMGLLMDALANFDDKVFHACKTSEENF